MPNPNLFIVGAPRCGTSTLHARLGQHPDVFMSQVKELHWFSPDFHQPAARVHVRDEAHYLSMFADAGTQRHVGEASPFYLYARTAAPAIRAFNPDARIIIALRHPADMMYSMYCLRRQASLFHEGQELLESFEDALAANEARMRGEQLPEGSPTEPGRCIHLCYRELARFTERVQQYIDVFGRDRVHVVLFDDLVSADDDGMRDVCRFLDIDAALLPDSRVGRQRRAASAQPRSRRLARMLWEQPRMLQAARRLVPDGVARVMRAALTHWNSPPPPPIDPSLRGRITGECAADIRQLQQLLERDLSSWLPRQPA